VYPILFQCWGFTLPSFGVMLALAFMAGFFWTLRRAAQKQESPDLLMEVYCWVIVAALVGARLCYLLFFPQLFLSDPLGILFNKGGLVWYGGMIGVMLMLLVYATTRKLNFWKLADIITPAAALGLAIGRIGCLLAGCCYGVGCTLPWAVHYPAAHITAGLPVHPVQLYETLSLLLLTVWLWATDRKAPYFGRTTCQFFVGYGLIRFALEYVRGDRLVWIDPLNLSASQVISLGFVLVGLLVWRTRRHYHSRLERIRQRLPVFPRPTGGASSSVPGSTM
jgi:phosphatidylglycerol---prolipoprotein diacylglyceryl transferase